MNESTHQNTLADKTKALQPLERSGASQTELTQPSVPPLEVNQGQEANSQPSWAPLYVTPAPPRSIRPQPRSNWLMIVLSLAAFCTTLIFGIVAFISLRLSFNRGTGTDATATVVALALTNTATTPMPTFFAPTPTVGINIDPWDGKQRFTILVMGIDKRPDETGTAFRTDTMILISLDPITRSIGMLSVPRDLYVDIPTDSVVGSYGLQRVNSAYFIGEMVRPGYGPQLAMQTVQYNLGIRVNDYVVFDFQAVIAAVDAVGGVDIDVPAPISDPLYPNMYNGYDPLYIPAGHIHMNGTLALKYARSRHGSSDLDRAKRQQQIILAVREKVLKLNMLPDLLVQAPGLWSQLSRDVHSGLSLDQLLRLVVYAQDIPKENIRNAVIDYGYVTPTMWNGAAVLIPNRTAIGPLLVNIFGSNYNQR